MTKKTSRIIAAVMLIAAIVFVAVAVTHTWASFPWSNTVTYSIYSVYAAAMVILFIAPFKKKRETKYER